MAKDPICGMSVDEKPSAPQSMYQGKTYYFCGEGCKRVFDADPRSWVRS